MNQRRPLKELNLLDRFLFDEAMEDPENVKTILDIILSQNTSLRHPPQTEKEQRTFPFSVRGTGYEGRGCVYSGESAVCETFLRTAYQIL